MVLQILIWWLVSTVLGLAALPLTTYLFRSLPDRGYPFARALGLLLVGYLAWLLAMLGLAPFGRGTLIVCMLVVLGIGLLATRTKHAKSRVQRAEAGNQNATFKTLTKFFPGWRLALAYELVFLAALLFMALLRARGPDPWGTERPMDFALFNAIQRSSSFPPHDPWLAGFSINYYYLGYLLMAAMALLSGLEASVAFNLSLALIYALTALGVAGVVLNLIWLSLSSRRQDAKKAETSADQVSPSPSRPVRLRSFSVKNRLAALAPILAIVFVLFAGNQGGTLAIITGTPRVLFLNGGDMWRAIQNGLGPRQPLPLNTVVQAWGEDLVTAITPTNTAENFDWWWSSRAIWDRAPNPADATRYYAITEFPIFSFFLGDMHPHVMALPFGLLALALALATLARPVAPVFTLTWRGWLELALTGIVLGSLYMINSWDFPTYLLLYLAALVLLYVRLGRGAGAQGNVVSDVASLAPSAQPLAPIAPTQHATRNARHLHILWPQLMQHAILVAFASFVLFAPFFMTFKSLVGSKEPLIDLPLLGSLTSIIGFVTWTKTPLHSFVIIFGLFLLPLLGFIFGVGYRAQDLATNNSREQVPISAPPVGALGIIARPTPPPALLPILPWVVLAALVLGVLFGFPLLFLLPLGAYMLLLAVRVVENPGVSFALLAAALGAFICFGTELIYIRDVFEGGAARMNTIFKFYYQVWLIWGMLAAYAVWWLVTQTNTERRKTTEAALWSSVVRLSSFVCLLLAALFFAGALTYPYFTAFKSLRDRPALGLQGKTPRQQSAAGAASIEWLRVNTSGNEVVLESVGNSYDGPPGGPGAAGVAASTGLATVLGWPGHEDQWRGGDVAAQNQIEPRKADVDLLYTTTDLGQARALLAQYNVDFVYVGEAERLRYTQESLDKFAQLGKPVFQQDEVVIYQMTN